MKKSKKKDGVVHASKFQKWKKHGGFFVLFGMLPILLIYLLIRIIPIGETIYMSLFNWNYITNTQVFLGFQNYSKMFHDDLFRTAFWNTTLIAFGMFIIIMPLSLVIANALNTGMKGHSVFEALYFLPVIMPMVPVTVIWKWILNTDSGLLNGFLGLFGLTKQAWLTNPTLALIVVIVIMIWKNLGYNVMIYLVGLRGIPKSYYEAAAIDGANSGQTFRKISLPLLTPITIYVSVTTLIKGYNVYSLVSILASDIQGAPGHLTRVLVYDMIENGFRYFKVGYASAEAVILLVVVLILTLIQMGIIRERDPKKKHVQNGNVKGGKRS